MTLSVTHRGSHASEPWYAGCDVCGLYTLGERVFIESLAGTDCPVCTAPDGEWPGWFMLDDGSGDVVVGPSGEVG